MTGARAAALGAALLALGGCPSENDGARCGAFCALADSCGMLPSPLGLDDGDCVARCKLSDSVSFDTLTGCYREAAPPGATPQTLWCGVDPVCALFDACLQTSYPGADVTGTTSLTVGFAATPPVELALLARAPGDDTCEASLDLATALPAVTPNAGTCQAIDIQQLQVGVAERAASALPAMACSAITLQTLVIPNLPPGAMRPMIDVTAVITPDGPSECRRFHGPRVVAAANREGTASALPIPTSIDTFLMGAPCVNVDAGAAPADASLAITTPDGGP